MQTSALTTTDNPFSPFTQFDEWLQYDMRKGYHTPSLLARVVVVSPELSPSDTELAIETAIDEIVKTNPNGLFVKVTQEDYSH